MRSSIGALALVALLAASCVESAPAAVLDASARFGEPVALPPPATSGDVSIEASLVERRSVRDFAPTPLDLDEIGQLFWSAQGVTDASGKRTAPSAGALYPLDVYAVTGDRLWHYLPDGHRAESRPTAGDIRSPLAELAFGQEWIADAPAIFVITGEVATTEVRYGAVAQRLVDRESGHAAQNILLEAVALGLAAVPVGGFDPDDLARLLGLPPGREVLYLLPVGSPG